jgi:O-antigen/teichoic acid export membrane protein
VKLPTFMQKLLGRGAASSDDAEQRRHRSIFAFFASSLASRGIGIGCQLLQVPIALRFLGNEAFGLWITLFSFGFVLAFTDFGIGLGVQNRIAEALGREDREEARAVFVTGLVFLLGVMLVLMAGLAPLTLLIDFASALHLTDPHVAASASAAILIVGLVWCLNVPLGLGQRLAYGAQLGWTHNAASTVSQVVLLVAVALGAYFNVSLTVFFVLTFASGTVVQLIFLVYLLRRLGWGRIEWQRFQPKILRELAAVGIYFFLQQIGTLVLFTAPPLILSSALGAAAVTPFNLTQRVFNLFMVVANALLLPIWPAYSEAKAREDWPWIRRTLWRSVGMVIALAVIPMIAAGPFVPRIISWWTGGAAALPTPTLVWLLVAWNALIVLQQPFGYLLAGISRIQRTTYYSILSTVVALAAIHLFLPAHGVNAIPLGLIVGFVPFILAGNIAETLAFLRSVGKTAPAAPIPAASASPPL